jgi:ATP-dependent Lon protease
MALQKSNNHKGLKPEKLKWTCDTDQFEFESTENVEPIEGIIGQQRAIKALKIGVEINSSGYNVFIAGLSGTGKLTTAKQMLEKIRPECPELYDYAYVNNFKDPDQPILLVFPAGKGSQFKKEMGNAIKFLQENIPQVLESDSFVTKKKKIIDDFSQKQQKLKDDFEQKLNKDNFTLGQVKVGEISRPEIMALIDGQPVFIQQLDELVRQNKISKEQADEITQKYTSYQTELQSLFKKSIKLNQEFQEKLAKLEKDTASDVINLTIDDLKEKHDIAKVKDYLEAVKENVFQNIELFKGQQPQALQAQDGIPVDYFKVYDVNVLLDNSKQDECPVLTETSPTYSNLFGIIEKQYDRQGGWYADFMSIKAGSMLRANGGYLIVNAIDALTEPGVWKTLKRVLMYNKLEIQDVSNLWQLAPSILKPEPIEINTKIIFIGNNQIYNILSKLEDDFNKIFKIKSDFDYEMHRTERTLNEYVRVIKKLINNEDLMDFNKKAVARLAELGARYAGEKDKLTTRFSYVADLVREANFWAKDNGDKYVSDYHVQLAYDSAKERFSLPETKLSEMIDKGTILIDTSGERVGQVNGLAVYQSGYYTFGKPTRITAAVSLGSGDIINVEREAGLSGSTHNKGVLIISGYFRDNFGKNVPLSFKASLVFEQGYGMIDGDSASSTEICALLSCLSGIPIKQNLSITGSVNQKGDIQPVGGINEKIEGFFEVSKSRGLDGTHGVIMPQSNVKDLMLKDEVINAVKENKFNIYPVERIEEAIEILTGVKAGKVTKTGRYQANTVFGMVEKTLREMREKVKPKSRQTSKTKSQKGTK